MKFSRTLLVELDRVDAVLIRTFPKQFDSSFDYYLHPVGDVWMVWPKGRVPTEHVVKFAEKNLDGEISMRRIALGQTSLSDFPRVDDPDCSGTSNPATVAD